MLSFAQFCLEHAATDAVLSVIRSGQPRDVSSPTYSIQFVLPDGHAVELDKDEVHARAAYEAGQSSGVSMRLIDVLRAGVVRAADSTRYQVCSRITSTQAQFIYDRAKTAKSEYVVVSIADASYADSNDTRNGGVGPIEINDKEHKEFDITRATPDTIRNWVNAHV